MVQALAPNRAVHALDIGILPRRSRSPEEFANAQPPCCFVEFFSVARVAIAKQITRRTVPRESFQQLPGRPFCCGIGSYSEMKWTPATMGENHKNKQKAERDRGNHEEIGRDQAVHVVVQKRAPILRRRPPVPDQVLRNRGLGQFDPSFNSSP
jgi:hypothetical protein